MKQLKCEICEEIIGQFDPDDLKIPVTGAMFTSKDPDHEIPDPFPHEIDWVWMKCPYCRNRPFIFDAEEQPNGPDRVLTPEGWWEIEPKGEYAEQVFGKEDANAEYDPITNETQPTITQAEVYTCKLCGREFPKRMGLVGHMKAHSKRKRND